MKQPALSKPSKGKARQGKARQDKYIIKNRYCRPNISFLYLFIQKKFRYFIHWI